MADLTGKDTPATDAKTAADKTGPVKPPVLEGTARPSAADKPTPTKAADKPSDRPADKLRDKPAAKPGEKTYSPTTPKPRLDRDEGSGGGNAWLAGLLGGALGLGAAYGLAWFGLWPAPVQQAPQADPRLAQFATAIPELETVTGTVQDELSTLTARVGTLETARAEQPAAAPAQTDPGLAEDVAALSARLDQLANTAGNAVGTEALAALEAELASLKTRADATAAELSEARSELTALAQSANDSAGAEAATIRLPLILSGLESAFDSGRAFDTELAALRRAIPDQAVPEAIALRADTGLPRPETVASQLAAVLPDMLAGRPINTDASWQDTTADWFRGLIAMRPAGAVEGDGPDAIIARLENAVARRDFVAAQAELTALPEPMRRAAGALAGDIDSLAAAQSFLADLRASVLTQESDT